MEWIGKAVIALVMCCAVRGAIAAIKDERSGLGAEFMAGIHAIGIIFIPVAGIMASIPILSQVVASVGGGIFSAMHSSPALAATSVIAVDMGGYQLAARLAESKEIWILAMFVGYVSGATIVFSIPIGLSMLEKKEHPYFALGIMAGILSIPFAVLVSVGVSALMNLPVRTTAVTSGEATYFLKWQFGTVLVSLAPVALFVLLLALGLRFLPDLMIRGFMIFGKIVDGLTKLVLVACIVQYFTGVFSYFAGGWPFDPIIADAADPFRALEASGYIGLMLCGAFPMVYLLKKYLAGPVTRLGRPLGLEPAGATGLIATVSNILALFRILGTMRPEDKVLNIAFAVCGAFLFADHLAFTANFQPNLIVPVMVGKIAGGIVGFVIAKWLCVPLVHKY